MTLALRSHAVVDHNHVITLQAPELRPGDRVEVIVLVEQPIEAVNKGGPGFLDTIADIEIDAPADYSTHFEADLYANRRAP
jgi:hypothetical protein